MLHLESNAPSFRVVDSLMLILNDDEERVWVHQGIVYMF